MMVPRPRIAVVACLAAALCTGCLESQAFRPAEQATARSPQGDSAAEYHLKGPDGADLAEVKLWSRGAEETKLDGRRVTSVHVGFELENESNSKMIFYAGQLELDYVTTKGKTVSHVRISRAGGDRDVSTDRVRQLDAYFAVEDDPSDIDAFSVHWAIQIAGRRYVERTPFIKALRPSGYYSPYYYYSPWYGPYYPGYMGYPMYLGPVGGGQSHPAPAHIPNQTAHPRN